MTRGRRRLFVALGVAAAVLLLGRLAATIVADRAWYVALGAGDVWAAKALDTVLLRGTAWLLGSIFVFANLMAVRRSVLKLVVPRRVANIEIDAEVSGRSLLGAAAITAAGVGALLSLAIGDWTTLTLARVARPFGEQEFFLERDLAVWTAWLPLERSLYGWAQVTIVAACCLVVALYALTPGLRWERGALRAASYVRRHLAILGACLLLLLAWGYGIERQLTLVNGPLAGTDVAPGALSGLLVLSILTAACAMLVLWAGYVGQTRLAFAGVTVVIVAAIGLQHVLPATLRWLREPGDAEKMGWSPGSTRAQFTRRAYAVQEVVSRAPVDSVNAGATIATFAGRVSVWSEAAVRAAVELGGWRRQVVGGIGWQRAPEGLVAVAAAREPASDTTPDAAGGWVVATVDASRPSPEGAAAVPYVQSRPLPPVSVHPAAIGYQVAPAAAGDLAAPRLGSGWRRLGAALAVQNPRIFLDGAELENARLVRWRDVSERVRRLAPVFAQGSPPVPIATGDSLYWAVHLYSSSRTYPLSQAISAAGEVTKYFRHAGVALVNAHTGRVAFAPVAEPDPLAAAWMGHFRSLFERGPAVPPSLLALVPPPVEGVRAQLLGLVLAGGVIMEEGEPPTPVRLPPPWSGDTAGTAGGWEVPYLPAEAGSAPAYAVPLVGESDDRPRALVVASGGGRPATVVVPIDTSGPAWTTLLGRLRAGAASGESGRGPLVAGPLQAVPAGDRALFVQPLYVWHGDGPPELAQVAVAGGDSVLRAPTLDALVAAPEAGSTAGSTTAETDPARLYAAMRDALRRGDWTAFGAAFEALGRRLGVGGRSP